MIDAQRQIAAAEAGRSPPPALSTKAGFATSADGW
jgi:hypothetical protein